MILEESALIHSASLPISISRPEYAPITDTGFDGRSAAATVDGMSLEDHERNLLVRALEKTNGNQTQAARLLRVTRDTLRYKMKKFSLK
jgi:DNA-binding NtrC family response regulator